MPLSRYKRKKNSTLIAVKVLLCYYVGGLLKTVQSLLVCDHFDLDESALGEGLDLSLIHI